VERDPTRLFAQRSEAHSKLSGKEFRLFQDLKMPACVCIGNRFSFRASGRVDLPAQFGKFHFRNSHLKRTNRVLVKCLLTAWLHSTEIASDVCREPECTWYTSPTPQLVRLQLKPL
jgi:hypothetical protein